jgi:hypothetical protein
MRLTLRTKLLILFGVSAAALVILIVASTLISSRVAAYLHRIEETYVPKVELGPTLQREFEHLSHALQDAVSARDLDALAATAEIKASYLERLAAASRSR